MTLLNTFWRKNITWIILIVFSFFAIVFFVLLPSVGQIEENKKTISDKQAELELLDYKLQVLQKRTHFNEDFANISSSVSTLLPDNTATSNFIIQLENLANSNNAIISNLSITEPKTAAKQADIKKAQSIVFSFDVAQNYETVTKIIKGLETFGRFNTTTSVNMISHDDGNISAQIKGTIYYGKQ